MFVWKLYLNCAVQKMLCWLRSTQIVNVNGIAVTVRYNEPGWCDVLSSIFPYRPHRRPWRGPFSSVLAIQWATSPPSLTETCLCKTSMWWRVSFCPGQCYLPSFNPLRHTFALTQPLYTARHLLWCEVLVWHMSCLRGDDLHTITARLLHKPNVTRPSESQSCFIKRGYV